MKLKSKHIRLGILGLFIAIGLFTQLFSNLWGVFVYGYTIPKNSFFSFKVTNESSNGYWLYGEDIKNYYTTLEKDHIEPYATISKEKTNTLKNFEKTNYNTWWPVSKPTKKQIDNILTIPISAIDSIQIYRLERFSMEGYHKTKITYQLSSVEIKEVLNYLRGSTNFYGGTPLSFGYSSEMVFHFKGKTNTIRISPHSWKIFQQDFDIPYNKLQKSELTGANYFPFITDDFALFLKGIEDKLK